jgi:ell wall binding domain 2 (CWB2)
VLSVYWRRRLAVGAGLLVIAGGIGAGAYLLADSLGGESEQPAPAPKIVVRKQQPQAAEEVGFPAFATKNTTRVAGADAIADAAGIALAVFPSAGGVKGPAAVSVVEGSDWSSGIAAASLTAPPVGAPILLTGTDEVPDLTADAVDALAPAGSAATGGGQVFQIGAATAPPGLRAQKIAGSSPAAIASRIDRLRQELVRREPQHVLLVSSQKASFAMPAAGWAARSGDPVLFVGRNDVPRPTLAALRRHKGVPVYVLGPPSVVSDRALKRTQGVASSVKRIGTEGEDPVETAIAFARYVDGSFGWNINDPGHGLVIASGDRPMDAAAAAPLSASGDWGPLLITDDQTRVPPALQGYLLDIKPGYIDDPTRAVYNHVWLIGDQDAISVGFQAQVDDLAEVAPVRSAAQGPSPGPTPGTPERERHKP